MSSIPQIFDHALLTARRVKALKRAEDGADFLLTEVVNDMESRLSMVLRDFPLCMELGGHTGLLAQRLAARKGTEQVFRLEQHADFFQPDDLGIVADPEMLPIAAESCNLIVSPLFLHWINDLPGCLIQIRHALKPDGLFLATLLGRDSLHELREVFLMADSEISGGATPRIAPLPDLKDMGSLLQRAGFTLPVADQDSLTVRYDTMFDLIRDLRQMGAANMLTDRTRRSMRRSTLLRAAELYQQKYADADGRIRATFQILSLSGWSPHESQQKPLKPGSATTPLAAILPDKSR
ncbi:methyltransferase domain-containing protein [Cohaesibacter sp. CAU 1516]|uniref:methyltransferase domain-containing protein n=1 Tax=Cohaesibacter sp. CAU 1516 TaxID=2576038 RepID=UPI0010FE7027|nr:methyltransferase domain-containing protein [Cohaesibacter sp. CAU 1516]TLP42607.1 methyltransferase domain-containing protein [Cohaesibacter sp. CAU 1516]